MTSAIERAIATIKEWKDIKIGVSIVLRGLTSFTPFKPAARDQGVILIL